MDEPLGEDDRRMLAALNAQARAKRRRTVLQWTLIFVPGIPLAWFGVIYLGMLGGAAAIIAVVAWGLLVQRLLPVREIDAS